MRVYLYKGVYDITHKISTYESMCLSIKLFIDNYARKYAEKFSVQYTFQNQNELLRAF